MFTKEEIEELVKAKIESDEKLGEQTAGSGHLSYVSYKLMDFSSKEMPDNNLQIDYNYSTFVETEFTYEPDNPPYEYNHKKRIFITSEKVIIKEEEIFEKSESEPTECTKEDWDKVKEEIMKYIEIFLAKIEWNYGENRAPIKYPPELYELFSEEIGIEYCCKIEMDLGGDEKLYFKSENPFELLTEIKTEFMKRFP
ncbi:MAG: hypothetical protein KKF62_18620 [Bacteroidetes bacterium]|nr:hypothetical protein [Bacteroidota bacterium]MBU1114398.1 hypothetical protein [Bacteroidota bacterium]MBU1798307.1 hypothetical protein [Bacteroidota bacterium]